MLLRTWRAWHSTMMQGRAGGLQRREMGALIELLRLCKEHDWCNKQLSTAVQELKQQAAAEERAGGHADELRPQHEELERREQQLAVRLEEQ